MNIDFLKAAAVKITPDNKICNIELEQEIIEMMGNDFDCCLTAKYMINPEFFYYLKNEFKKYIEGIPVENFILHPAMKTKIYNLSRYYIVKQCLENHPDEQLIYSTVILFEKQLLKPDQIKTDAEWLEKWHNIILEEI